MNKAQQKQAESRTHRVSRQCGECLKFRQNTCKGKAQATKRKVWGTTRPKLTGLNFCSRYEFDETLYEYPHKLEGYKAIRIRQIKKQIAKETKDHSEIVDTAAGLSSSDFGTLVI